MGWVWVVVVVEFNYTRKASVWAVLWRCASFHEWDNWLAFSKASSRGVGRTEKYVEWGPSKSYVTDDLYVSAEDQVV